MVCLSLATIFILIVATVTIVTVISKTPIIILALGQAQAGHMDLTIKGSSNLNNSRIRELTKQDSMPRIEVGGVSINGIHGTGWLMDFGAENRNHLGHYGYDILADEVFLHESFGYGAGSLVDVEMSAFGASIYNIVDFLEQKGLPDNMTEENFNASLYALKS